MSQNRKSKIENQKLSAYPKLSKSYKNRFPFRIAATSFIYPDRWIPNVQRVGPFVDEIELLFFESAPDSLPAVDEIRALAALSTDLELTYDVHLPVDIVLGVPRKTIREATGEKLKRIFELTAPLNPTTWTLHIPYDGPACENESITRWREGVFDDLRRLLDGGIPGRRLSLETLDYPVEWLTPFLMELDLSLCMDVGHLIRMGAAIEAVYYALKARVSILHLHGTDGDRDHQPLDRLSETEWAVVLKLLGQFDGVVSVEVFSFDNLRVSLDALDTRWHAGGYREGGRLQPS